MQLPTIFTFIFIGILVYISYCNGDTCSCTCCSGNECKPTLQGTISLSFCNPSDCQSACIREYATQCKLGIGSQSFVCSGSASSPPNWLGIFAMSYECDTRSCRCPTGNLIISRPNMNNIRIRGQFSGQCFPGMPPMDLTMSEPLHYSIGGLFLNQSIFITLSKDSRTVRIENPAFPSCSETAKRSGSVPTVNVNLSFISLLFGLMILKLIIF